MRVKFLILYKLRSSAKKIAREEMEKRKTEFNKIREKENMGQLPPAVRKGQIKIDFIFALVFFTILVFYIGMQINNSLVSGISDSKMDTLKSEAESILNILVSTKGNPENWEFLPQEQVIRIGLASAPYNLSSSKIDKLKNNCNLMDRFGDINYRLAISGGSGIILSCGYGGPRVTAKSEMPVVVNGKYGRAILEMW